MSAPLPDNISPVSPEHLHEPFMPRVQLALRIGLALLALTYAWFVPSALLFMPYIVFLLGTIIYVAAQGLLMLGLMLNGSRPTLTTLITLLDVVAALVAIANDPAGSPPTLFLLVAALGLAGMQHGSKTYGGILLGSMAAMVLVLIGRQEIMGRPLDFAFFSTLVLVSATCLVIPLLAANLEHLRYRSARVTELDPLTGLGNRWTFYEAAKYLLPYHHRNMTPMVVMFAEIEISQKKERKGRKITKAINHFLLKQFATLAEQRLRSSDVAAYYGANEFAFLLVDTTTKDAEGVAFDLQQQFNQWAKEKELPAYVHIGMAVVPHRPVALDQILISINAALYRARQYKKGVSGAVFADPEQTR